MHFDNRLERGDTVSLIPMLTNHVQAFKEKNPQWPVVNDCTVEYVLGDDKFTCTAWIDGKLAVVVDFAYMGDKENTILDKVSKKQSHRQTYMLYPRNIYRSFQSKIK